jgi:hypothetical protein
MQRLSYTDVLFDSKATSDYDNPNFVMNPPINNVVGYAVNWINVPSTYYVIDGTNNTLSFTQLLYRNNSKAAAGSTFLDNGAIGTGSAATGGTGPGGVHLTYSVTFDVILKPGTYNNDTFNYELKRALSETSATFTAVAPSRTVYVDYPNLFEFYVEPDTSRAVIYHAKTEELVAFSFNFNNSTCGPILGFQNVLTASSSQIVWRNGAKVNSAIAMATIRSPSVVKFIGGTTLNLHSNLPVANAYRTELSNNNVIFRFPVTGNYTALTTYYGSPEMSPCTRSSVDRVGFYLTNGDKTVYGKHSGSSAVQSSYTLVPYIPFNGEGFSVSIRFYTDDGQIYLQ